MVYIWKKTETKKKVKVLFKFEGFESGKAKLYDWVTL